jgi:hypothetical protein
MFILRGLDQLERDLNKQEPVVYRGQPEQITRFTEDALREKNLVEGEDFWFKSAENNVHGWILKPKEWKAGERKKWPVLMLIHGGLLDVLLLRTPDDRMVILFFRTTRRLGRVVVNSLESQRFCATRVFRNRHQSDRIHGFWPRSVMAFKQLMISFIYYLFCHLFDLPSVAFTDAIAEDWGGKPFVDLKNGWQHVLDKYPEVGIWSNLLCHQRTS